MKKLTINEEIKTKRSTIKMVDVSFAGAMFDLVDSTVTEFMPWDKLPSVNAYQEKIQEWNDKCINEESWDSSILDLDSDKLIGKIGIVKYHENIEGVELGYWLGKKYRGEGIMTECVQGIMKVLFDELDYKRVLIRATKENINSRNVAERCGFKLDGILRNNDVKNGIYVDEAYYTLLKTEYKKDS